MMIRRFISCVLALAACSSDPSSSTEETTTASDTVAATDSDTDETPTIACDPKANGEPVGCVYGKLVDVDGNPVVGVRVSACSGLECIYGTTDASGAYNIQGISVAPHRIDVLGEAKGIVTMIWWQPVPEGVQSRLEEPVKVYPTSILQKKPLVPADGGTVLLADDQLELTVAPDTLKYPIGTVDKSMAGFEILIEDLPPYDIAPWQGKEAKSRAFILNPFPVKATASPTLKVFGVEDAVDTLYTVYSADGVEGNLEEVGTMRADGAGTLTLEPGSTLEYLATLIIVPSAN